MFIPFLKVLLLCIAILACQEPGDLRLAVDEAVLQAKAQMNPMSSKSIIVQILFTEERPKDITDREWAEGDSYRLRWLRCSLRKLLSNSHFVRENLHISNIRIRLKLLTITSQ